VLLTTGAVWPGEFVTPIQDSALEQRATGRYVESGCSRCGRRVYLFPGQAHAIACRDCRYGAPWKRIWKRIASRVYVLVWLAGMVAIIGLAASIVPENSFAGRHISWVTMPLAVAWFVLLIWILGHMDDPPPLSEADTSARPAEASSSSEHGEKRKRRRR
jgi:DNA-directed RNA polymerase subunit RPC12/RpoP